MALVAIRGVRKTFGETTVLDGIDLDIEKGEFLTLIGKSGSGKSVLLKCLMGLIPVDEGSIRFDGQELTGLAESEWVAIRRRIGMLFQESALFDSLSVAENIAYALREAREMTEAQIRERVTDCLQRVSLAGIEQMWPADLSGGMRKRVGLARAIAMRPELVLYDEPTEGLDPINVTRVNRLLNRLRHEDGVTTVVVTHNMRSAFDVSDRLAFLHGGKVAHVGTPDELRQEDDPRLAPFRKASEVRLRRPSLLPPPPA
ncbi:MAG: ABC transporter ATP-binding protein [Sandaracinaceae bacterium]